MQPPMTKEQSKIFVLPNMTPDQIDKFITWLYDYGITYDKYATAGNNFRRNRFIEFTKFYVKKYGKGTQK